MANILDYLEWRGDISLSEDPFNAVDNLVLSWMAYVNLDEIMPNGIYNQAITIEEAIKRFFAKYNLEEKLKEASLTRTSALLFARLADCPRFGQMKINFLYVYGPGSEAASVEEYASRYPGDGYVDMVGFDMYHRNPQQGDSFVTNFTKELQIVDDFAQAHGKLVAVTETGTAHDVAEGDNQTALLKSENTRPDWHQEILDGSFPS